MSTTYTETKNELTMATKPVVVCAAQSAIQVQMKAMTNKEDIIANTMSVDSYFDELIDFFCQKEQVIRV